MRVSGPAQSVKNCCIETEIGGHSPPNTLGAPERQLKSPSQPTKLTGIPPWATISPRSGSSETSIVSMSCTPAVWEIRPANNMAEFRDIERLGRQYG